MCICGMVSTDNGAHIWVHINSTAINPLHDKSASFTERFDDNFNTESNRTFIGDWRRDKNNMCKFSAYMNPTWCPALAI